jgi:hypothetical protein
MTLATHAPKHGYRPQDLRHALRWYANTLGLYPAGERLGGLR